MAEGTQTPRPVRFGLYDVDLASGEVRKKGSRVRLQEKPFQILCVLLERPGEVVTRSELRERLWPADTWVDFDHGLNAAVNKLREALGDTAENPRFVETLPRRGYRFIAPVERPGHARRDDARIQLAVLPFVNRSGDAGQDYFAVGLSEELVFRLARLSPRRLALVARSSARTDSHLDLQGVVRETGVDFLVAGSYGRAGDGLKVHARLIRAHDLSYLWAEAYEGPAAEPFALQEQIAEAVARSLAAAILPGMEGDCRPCPAIPEAYDAYLRGRWHWNRRTPTDLEKALRHLRAATQADTGYALAHAALGDACSLAVEFGVLPPRTAVPEARAALRRAVEIEPELARAHAGLACLRHRFDWDWEGAGEDYRRSLRLDSAYDEAHHWYALYLSQLGRHEEAVREVREALRLEPLCLIINTAESVIFLHAGRPEEAVESARRVLDLDATFAPARLALSRAYLRLGRAKEAVAEARIAAGHAGDAPFIVAGVGVAHAAAGQPGAARRVLQELDLLEATRTVCPYLRARIHVALGEADRAFACLAQAAEERSGWLTDLRVDPELAPLRADPRFRKLLATVGLSEKRGRSSFSA